MRDRDRYLIEMPHGVEECMMVRHKARRIELNRFDPADEKTSRGGQT